MVEGWVLMSLVCRRQDQRSRGLPLGDGTEAEDELVSREVASCVAGADAYKENV